MLVDVVIVYFQTSAYELLSAFVISALWV